MLAGFRKPIVMTGSQLPLALPRSDARQNLLDSLCCATASFSPPHVHLQEVAICFGGRLMRGNRASKVNSSAYQVRCCSSTVPHARICRVIALGPAGHAMDTQPGSCAAVPYCSTLAVASLPCLACLASPLLPPQAFDSLNYPHFADMGVDVQWNTRALLNVEGVYRPRFNLIPHVMRVPIIPGTDPRLLYGDLAARGVKGLVLEAFGVGAWPYLFWGGSWLPLLPLPGRHVMCVGCWPCRYQTPTVGAPPPSHSPPCAPPTHPRRQHARPR